MTFGTVLYNYCKDLRVVQELLGHASSKTTERYTGVTQAAEEHGGDGSAAVSLFDLPNAADGRRGLSVVSCVACA